MINANMLYGYFDNFCIKGNPNAAVLPLPVSELAITDYPDIIFGIVKAWIAVGV
jgi:hypothetical protein